jgi:hypothetical protein
MTSLTPENKVLASEIWELPIIEDPKGLGIYIELAIGSKGFHRDASY